MLYVKKIATIKGETTKKKIFLREIAIMEITTKNIMIMITLKAKRHQQPINLALTIPKAGDQNVGYVKR